MYEKTICRIGRFCVFFVFFILITIPAIASAHQSGCHRWHSCPSDTGSYVEGDAGYVSQYPTYKDGVTTYPDNPYYRTEYEGTKYVTPGYTSPPTPSCPTNSYYDGVSSCTCNSGYVVSSGQCRLASLVCSDQIGLMSQYNSSTKKCECMYGYEYNGSNCVYKSTSSYSAVPTYTDTSTDNNCPLNSHTSLSDPTMCSCNGGFEINTAKTACIRTPVKSNIQICQDSFGINVDWDGTKATNGDLNCNCKTGYVWNSGRTACMFPPPTPTTYTAPKIYTPTTPTTTGAVDSSVQPSKIYKGYDINALRQKYGIVVAPPTPVVSVKKETKIPSAIKVEQKETTTTQSSSRTEKQWYKKIFDWLFK